MSSDPKQFSERALYTPEPELRRPGVLLRSMWRDLIGSRELAWRLLVRNIRSRYRRSALGIIWAFAPPLLTTGTFVILRKAGIVNAETAVPYVVYLLVGTLLWQTFVDSVTAPIRLVKTSKQLLARIVFPREALILAALGEITFNLLIRSVIVIAALGWYRIMPGWQLSWAPATVSALILFGFGVGLVLTPIALLYDDVEWTIASILALWFFVTPVAYTSATASKYALLLYNPVSPLLNTARESLLGVPITQGVGALAVSMVTVALLSLGWVAYRVTMPHLVARIGS